ncbi:MAG: hypothetical protein QOF92_1666 [Pseudonocardiales bacterium]|nr:hypothetical protein [Pseudonocardiales bacterium]
MEPALDHRSSGAADVPAPSRPSPEVGASVVDRAQALAGLSRHAPGPATLPATPPARGLLAGLRRSSARADTPVAPRANTIRRQLMINGHPVSPATINAQQTGIRESCGPKLTENGYDVAALDWPRIFTALGELAAHGLTFEYAATSAAIMAIVNSGYSSEVVVANKEGELATAASKAPKPKKAALTPEARAAVARSQALLDKELKGATAHKLDVGDIHAYFDTGQNCHHPPGRKASWGDRETSGKTIFKYDLATYEWHSKNTLPVMIDFAKTEMPADLAEGKHHPTGQGKDRDGIHYEGYGCIIGGERYVFFHCYPAAGSGYETNKTEMKQDKERDDRNTREQAKRDEKTAGKDKAKSTSK